MSVKTPRGFEMLQKQHRWAFYTGAFHQELKVQPVGGQTFKWELLPLKISFGFFFKGSNFS
jgi:hypothetical protein